MHSISEKGRKQDKERHRRVTKGRRDGKQSNAGTADKNEEKK